MTEDPPPCVGTPAARRRLLSGPNLLMILMLAVILLGAVALAVILTDDLRAGQLRALVGAQAAAPQGSTARQAGLPVGTLPPTPSPSASATVSPSVTSTASPTATLTPTASPSATPSLPPELTDTPAWVTAAYAPLPLDQKWIEVDLTAQVLRAYEGAQPVRECVISSGRPGLATRQGRYRIYTKHLQQDMVGQGYYVPAVPHVQYFVGSIAIHGAYWGPDWGTPSTHGCVNVSLEDAEWLFNWTDPALPEGQTTVHASESQPGTWVLVHK